MAVGLDNGHSAATTTTNGRGLEAGSIAEATETIVTAPRDGNEPVAATINGRHYGPRSGLRRRIPEADRNRIVLEDGLRAVNTTNSNGHNVEASTALIAYTTKLLQDMDAEAELDNVSGPKSCIMTTVDTDLI